MGVGNGEAIRRARLGLGMTQDEMAEKMGVSRRTIGEWERSGKVPGHRRPALSDALGQSIDLDGEGAAEEGPEATLAVEINGWMVTIRPSATATPEQIAGVQDAVAPVIIRKLRELGFEK